MNEDGGNNNGEDISGFGIDSNSDFDNEPPF
jgi:hypothetical protein